MGSSVVVRERAEEGWGCVSRALRACRSCEPWIFVVGTCSFFQAVWWVGLR